MSKRKLLELVEEDMSAGGTIPACRPLRACDGADTRRSPFGNFCERIGVAKNDSTIDMALLEHCHPRGSEPASAAVMAVLQPAARW